MQRRAGPQWIWVIALMLCWATSAAAQDEEDPFAEDEATEDDPFGADEEEAAPEEAPAEEPEPEPEADAEAGGSFGVGAGAEGEVGAEGDVGAEAPFPEPAAEVDEPPPAEGEEEIVVVGSRLKRTSFSQPSAVQVVTRKEIEATGADTVADLVKFLTVNSGSQVQAELNSAGGATAQFNLRGLGLNATLVLLNGRRLPLSGAGSADGAPFVDINTIPLAAIERIEILRGGASAIYGSDAVAGVVNIITRKEMSGFEASIGGQVTDDFDQHEYDVSLIGGATGDRTRAVGMVAYYRQLPLDANDRDFTFAPWGDPPMHANVSTLGQPSGFVLLNPAFTPIGSTTDPNCGTPQYPLSQRNLDDPVERRRFLCLFDFNSYYNLVLDQQRANTWLSVEHDISPYTQAFIEGGYSRNRALRALSPSFPLTSFPGFRGDHSYFPGTTYEGERLPTPAVLLWYGRTQGGDAPRTYVDYGTDSLHTVAGLKGDFGGIAQGSTFEDWNWELAGTWGNSRYTFGLEDALAGPLSDALNACGPDGDPADCWNPFTVGAPNSAQLRETIHGELKSRVDTELTTVNADIGGPLVELPGGDLGLAIGMQTRRETASTDLDHDANEENYIFLVGGPDWAAERNILAAYGELILPFFEGFELQGAGRLENYDDVGSTFNPKVGLSWTPLIGNPGPIGGLRLRGTFATSFRAPSLLQVDGAQTTLEESFDVDTADADMDGMPDDADGDGVPDPQRAPSATFIAVRTRGNADLKPEEAVVFTGGIDWEIMKGLRLEADYWNYNYENLVVRESHQQIIDEDYLARSDARITRAPNGALSRVDTMFVNAPTLKTDGIDFSLYYNIELAPDSSLLLSTRGTYVLSFDIETPTRTFEGAGNRNSANPAPPIPALRVNFPIQYTIGVHGIGLVARYISGYDNDDPDSAQEAIDGWLTFDLQYGFRIQETDTLATMVKIGVLNLLDSDPPGLDAPLGYDTRVHDPRGRIIYGRLTQEF